MRRHDKFSLIGAFVAWIVMIAVLPACEIITEAESVSHDTTIVIFPPGGGGDAVSSINLDVSLLTLQLAGDNCVGTTVTMTVDVQPVGSNYKLVVSPAEGVINVDRVGRTNTYTISPAGDGQATITGTMNGKTDSKTFTVLECGQLPKAQVSMSANPKVIQLGQSSIISGEAVDATTCDLSSEPFDVNWTGTLTAIANRIVILRTVSPTQTTPYKAHCIGPGGTADGEVTVTVLSANVEAVVSGSVFPNTCPSAGMTTGQLALYVNGVPVPATWVKTSNNNVATVSGSTFTGITAGQETFTGTSTQNPSHTAPATVTVLSCPAVPTITGVTITVTPSGTITSCPSTVTIQATVHGTGQFNPNANLSASQGVLTLAGVNTWTWQATTTGPVIYTAMPVGDASKAGSVTVQVDCPPPPALLLFSISPETIVRGSGVRPKASWSGQGFVSCSASSVPVDNNWNGSLAVPNGNELVKTLTSPSVATSYTIDCVTASGEHIIKTDEVTVTEPQEEFEASPQLFTAQSPGGNCPDNEVAINLTGGLVSTAVSSNPSAMQVVSVSSTQVRLRAGQVSAETPVKITITSTTGLVEEVNGKVFPCTTPPPPTCPPTIDYSPKGGSIGVNQNKDLMVDDWPSTSECVPFWYVDRPAFIQVAGADAIRNINGNWFYAGKRAVLRGVAETPAGVTVTACVQADIGATSPKACYSWTGTAAASKMGPEGPEMLPTPHPKFWMKPGISQTYEP